MMMTVVTFSRNVFLPITNMCRNRCAYCGFRQEPPSAWFMIPEEVMRLAQRGVQLGCSEALLTLGERPEVYPQVRLALRKLGFSSTVDYLESLCKQILRLGLLPHTNAGLLEEEELRRLRRYNASMGLMLECASPLWVHSQSPGKDPQLRLKVIETAGKLKIPFTTGILVGIGETRKDIKKSLEVLKEVQDTYGHIQEIIIQPFQPKPGTPMQSCPPPEPERVLYAVKTAARIFPNTGIQIPPNLVPDVVPFLRAGANDLGGISPLTPDFINPEHPWPNIDQLRMELESRGFRLRERLPIYPKFAKLTEYMSPEVRRVVEDLRDEEGFRR